MNIPFVFVVKVGITGDLDRRFAEIDKSNIGFDLPIFWARVPFAYQLEQWVHERCRIIQVHWFKGSGKTERFLFPAVIPTIVGVAFIRIVQWSIYFLIFALFAWAVINSK